MRRTVTATLALALTLGSGAAFAAEDDPSATLGPPEGLTCRAYATSEVANDPFAFGATAAISCPKTESEGFPRVDYLTLFRFPDMASMGDYWVFRSGQNPDMPQRDDACADGKRGHGSWAHGEYFCYVSRSGGHALLRWTDDRTDTYGVLDATNARLAPLHSAWLELRGDGVSSEEPTPAPPEAFEQDGLPTLYGYTTDDGLIVLRDEDFCAYLLDGIWGGDSVILSELVFARGTDTQSIERAVGTYGHEPRTDEYALERCVRALNQYRLRSGSLMPLPWWAHENAVIPEVHAELKEAEAVVDPAG